MLLARQRAIKSIFMSPLFFSARPYGRRQEAFSLPLMATLASISKEQPYIDWLKWPVHQRINYALSFYEPDSAVIAFYQGLGFKSLNEYMEAVNRFERAAEMNPKLAFLCELNVCKVYEKIGNYKAANQCLKKSFTERLKLEPKDLEAIKLAIGEDLFEENIRDITEEPTDLTTKINPR